MVVAANRQVDRLTDEPILSQNARKVLDARYLKKNEAGECTETPRELFRRVARTIAEVEALYGADAAQRQSWEDRFYDLMTSGAFMPNSPTLMNAGRDMGMLSACFVLPVRDSIVDIFNSITHTALIQKAGGGTGFAFDELRPTGDYISSSGGTTSGPISFWKAFSEATNAIQQGAFRRGANMGMMYIHHPDILKFLHAKQDLSQFTNYNISVKVTDQWMKEFLADADSPHVVRNGRTGKAFVLPRSLDIWKYDVRNLVEVQCVAPPAPNTNEKYYATPKLVGPLPPELRGQVYTKRDIWNIIVRNAWQTGEPGVVFIDRINEANPTPHVGRIEATNPCGEQPLLPYEACNLGSVNLGRFVRNACTPQAEVDWDALREAVHLSTRYLDNVIDANNYPLAEIDQVCKANRKIGLGIMGFADALYALNVGYNTAEGVEWGEAFMKFVNDEAHNYSEMLARQRGCFPNWRGSHWETRHRRMMRNACTTTVAPTGTISIIANCSGGIEPLFSLAFVRNVLRGQKQGEKPLVEVNELFCRVAKERGFYSDELIERIAREGTLAHIAEIPEDVQRVFVCAHDIAPDWHMQMQAAFQRHCDSSISKTINFPHAAEMADVERIYQLAFELGCKGVTVYRDGCRDMQPMALKKEGTEGRRDDGTKEETRDRGEEGNREQGTGNRKERRDLGIEGSRDRGEEAAAALPTFSRSHVPTPAAQPRVEPMDLPEIVSGLRIRQMTPFGNMHVKITVDPRLDRELEVFAQLGKGGDVATSDLEAICRMVSLWLRAGGSLRHVIKQLEGIGSSLQIPTKTGRIMSLGDGLACALKKYSRAKEHFGLRPLLLGEVDLAELDNPSLYNRPTVDRPARPAEIAGANGNGSNGGNGTHGGGNGGAGGNGGSGTASGNGSSVHAGRGNGGAIRVTRPAAASDAPAVALSAAALPAAQPAATRATMAVHGAAGDGPVATAVADETEAAALTRLDSDAIEAISVGDAEAGSFAVNLTPAPAAEAANLADAKRPAVGANGRLRHAHDEAANYKLKCPECGGAVAWQEGCRKCYACGWGAC